jgi:Na+-transporting methylmalonyl-CoA/oxaloacetate decarboxylase gamma subunit
VDQPALWLVSANAFAAVVVLLTILAVAIRLLSVAFPERAAPPRMPPAPPSSQAPPRDAAALDAPTLAALQGAVQRALPGGRVVRVEDPNGGPT